MNMAEFGCGCALASIGIGFAVVVLAGAAWVALKIFGV